MGVIQFDWYFDTFIIRQNVSTTISEIDMGDVACEMKRVKNVSQSEIWEKKMVGNGCAHLPAQNRTRSLFIDHNIRTIEAATNCKRKSTVMKEIT